MKSHSEFRAAIETTLGRKLDSKHAGAAAAQLRTSYGELRVEIREDTPAIFMRFTDTGEGALPDGVGFAGVWDIVPSPGHPADADEREWCVKTLQRRLGLAGYVPPEPVNKQAEFYAGLADSEPIGELEPDTFGKADTILDQPFDGSLSAAERRAKVREFGDTLPQLTEADMASVPASGDPWRLPGEPAVGLWGVPHPPYCIGFDHPATTCDWLRRIPEAVVVTYGCCGPGSGHAIVLCRDEVQAGLVRDALNAADPLDQPFDGSLPADKLIAAAQATGDLLATGYEAGDDTYAKMAEILGTTRTLAKEHWLAFSHKSLDGLMDEGDNDDHPLWCVNAQIKGLMEGIGATEDLDAVKDFLRATGLPESTAVRMRDALCASDQKLTLAPDEKALLAGLLRDQSAPPQDYPATGLHAAMVRQRQETIAGLLEKLESLQP